MEHEGRVRVSRGWLWACVAAVPFLVLAAVRWSVPPSADSSDYAQYIQHARALLDGRPYTDTGYLRSELNRLLGPRALPPGLPLTLLPLVALFGVAMAPMKALMVVCGAGFLVLAAVRLRRSVSPVSAVVGAAFAGVAIESHYATAAPITDLGFAALLWALLLVADRPGRWTLGRSIVIAGLGASLMAYRVVGIAVVPALALFALTRSREERGPVLGVLAAWAVVGGVAALAVLRGLPLLDLLGAGSISVATRFVRHLLHYPQLVQEVFLYPLPSNLGNDLYHVAASLLAVVAGVAVVRRERWSLLTCFVAAYMLLLLLAPPKEARYVWPLYPLLAACFVEGAILGLRRVVGAVRATRLALVLTAVPLLAGTLAIARQPAPPSLEGPSTRQLFDAIRDARGRGNVRVLFANPRVLSLEVGVPSMGMANAGDTPTLLRSLARQGITHVVWGQVGGLETGQERLSRAVAAHPDAFDLQMENETYRLYRIRYIPADTFPPPRPSRPEDDRR